MDGTGQNQVVATFCKENDWKVEHVPLDTPKLNNVVERRFTIRWETAKTWTQNERLKPIVLGNKKVLVEEIITAYFLNE